MTAANEKTAAMVAEEVHALRGQMRNITWILTAMLAIILAGVPWAYGINERLTRVEENTREIPPIWLTKIIENNTSAIKDIDSRMRHLERVRADEP